MESVAEDPRLRLFSSFNAEALSSSVFKFIFARQGAAVACFVRQLNSVSKREACNQDTRQARMNIHTGKQTHPQG